MLSNLFKKIKKEVEEFDEGIDLGNKGLPFQTNSDMKVFFDMYRLHFGALNQSQVDGLNYLVPKLLAEKELSLHQIAYILATVKHECADRWQPVTEFISDTTAERNYGYHTALGRRLGNIRPGQGALYKGRGYVQITGRRNYQVMSDMLKVDLVAAPEKTLEHDISYKILVRGMMDGSFTGKSLPDYVNHSSKDYRQARRVVNGMDKSMLIAGYANKFEKILMAL